MAVTLDYGVLGQLSGIFMWLLIFLIAYGLFKSRDPFGMEGGTGIYALLSAVIAFLLVLSNAFVAMLSFSLPWFAVLIFVIFFLIFFAKVADPSADLTEGGGAGKGIFISIIVIILLFGLGNAISADGDPRESVDTVDSTMQEDAFVPADQVTQPTQQVQEQSSAAAVIFHPNVLGMAILLLIAVAALFLLTK